MIVIVIAPERAPGPLEGSGSETTGRGEEGAPGVGAGEESRGVGSAGGRASASAGGVVARRRTRGEIRRRGGTDRGPTTRTRKASAREGPGTGGEARAPGGRGRNANAQPQSVV